MSFFGLIFLIFLGWIVYNVARIYLRIRSLRNQGRDFFNRFATGFGANGSPRDDSKSKPPEPKRPAKKIDPEVGEYVRFEEVSVTAEQTSTVNNDGSQTDTTRVTVEEQIVDVEWEDLPPEDKQ